MHIDHISAGPQALDLKYQFEYLIENKKIQKN